ncbi:hypothetical protein ACFLQN_03530 [Candidatus Aenigmatarchaeota archaeon]
MTEEDMSPKLVGMVFKFIGIIIVVLILYVIFINMAAPVPTQLDYMHGVLSWFYGS